MGTKATRKDNGRFRELYDSFSSGLSRLMTLLYVGLMALISYVLPERVGKYAFHLYALVPKSPSFANRLPPGERVAVPMPQLPDSQIVAEVWGDRSKPVVLFVHGWGGYRGMFSAFVPGLVAKGFCVVAFDCLGHGESSVSRLGKGHACGPEMSLALHAVVGHFGAPHGLVGHSFGCAISVAAMINPALSDAFSSLQRLVLISPPPDAEPLFEEFMASLRLSPRSRKFAWDEFFRVTGMPAEWYSLSKSTSKYTLPEGLVVHDTTDKMSPYKCSLQITANYPNSTLKSTTGLGHFRILSDPDVVESITAFIAKA